MAAADYNGKGIVWDAENDRPMMIDNQEIQYEDTKPELEIKKPGRKPKTED